MVGPAPPRVSQSGADSWRIVRVRKLLLGGVIVAIGAVLARRRQRTVDLALAQSDRVRGVTEAGRKRVARLKREPDLEELTKEELYQRAQAADIPGRSEMSKDELIAALRTSAG
jgi:hypothetical protein